MLILIATEIASSNIIQSNDYTSLIADLKSLFFALLAPGLTFWVIYFNNTASEKRKNTNDVQTSTANENSTLKGEVMDLKIGAIVSAVKDSLKEDFGELKTAVSNISTKVEVVGTKVDTLNTKVDTLTTKVDTFDTTLNTAVKDIAVLKNTEVMRRRKTAK